MTAGALPTVVVPVYGGLDDVRRCLESVVRHLDSVQPFELLVVDDASPQREVPAFLEAFEREQGWDRFTLVRNEQNQGFVRTCNQAMRGAPGDVVLLNSDTIVTEGWLDRLVEAAQRPDVATVTPLTNFGSIATLPPAVIEAFALDGDDPRIDECAAFVLRESVALLPEVITGVGFCMYVTRAALDACGYFDEDAFGAGYGEEVDLCIRASGLGFRHLIDDRTYVYHRGGASFSERRAEGLKRSSAVIHQRHPFFRAANAAERRRDPLRLPLRALELGLAPRDPERRHVLQLLHSKPGELGGTEKHFWRLMQGLLSEVDVSVLQPCPGGFLLTTMWSVDGRVVREEHLLPGDWGEGTAAIDPLAGAGLQTALDLFDFDAVHIQNIVHHSLAPLAILADFPGPVACSVRDLYLACPHHWLLYRNQEACGIPEDLRFCAECLPQTRQLDLAYLEDFRATVARHLGTVDRWVFASQSAVDFFLRAYDVEPERIALIPHGAIIDPDRGGREIDEHRILDEPLRVAFVGMGWAKKGLPTVNQLADAVAGTTIEIHHFGELRDPISPAILEHGTYDNNVLPELLHRAGIQVVLLPGAFVETFGHVMTESLIVGLPVIGNRHGALGERIRAAGVGWTIDPEDVGALVELVENLDRCRHEVLQVTRRVAALDLASVDDTVDRYLALYRPRPSAVDAEGAPPPMDDLDRARMQRELRAMATVNRRLQVQLDEPPRAAKPQSAPRQPSSAAPGAGSPPPAGALVSVRRRLGRVRRFSRRQLGLARRSIEHRGLAGATKSAGRKAARRARRALR